MNLEHIFSYASIANSCSFMFDLQMLKFAIDNCVILFFKSFKSFD